MHVPLTICDFLDRAEWVYPERIGIVDEPEQLASSLGALNYQQIAKMARSFATFLDSLNIKEGERIAIVSQNAARFLLALYGTSGSGRILVPINFRLTPEEISFIIEHSQASLLLIDPELAESLRELPCAHKIILGAEQDSLMFRSETSPQSWDRDECSTATINYTSGTTARPKGVELTHRNLWINASSLGLQISPNDRDVYLHTLPLFHCNGWGLPFILASLGVKQIILRKVHGGEILRRIQDHGVTLLAGAPAVVHAILEAAQSWSGPIPGRGRLRILVAGAPPPTRTIARVESELGWEFMQLYGLTETSPMLTINRNRQEWDELDSQQRAQNLARAGAPGIGVKLKIDENGEILAQGNTILQGYWRQEEASSQALAGGWFHTGDGGCIDEAGYVNISDRKKDVIISGGENISSLEVEDILCRHPAVSEVAVIGVPDEKWGETVKALVVLSKGSELSEKDLIQHCRDHLAHFKCPTTVEFRAELLRTATGKLQKFKLRAPYWAGRDRLVY